MLAGLLSGASATLGAGALWATGLGAAAIGGKGFLGSTMGASGLTGALMSVGVISSTPLWVPYAVIGSGAVGVAGLGYGSFRLYQIRQKILATPEGEEAEFTEAEAWAVEKILTLFMDVDQKTAEG